MFIENYHRLCNNMNMAPSAVAEKIGLKRAAYTRWKKGTVPTDATISKLADFFGVSPSVLTDETKPTTPEDDGLMGIREAIRENPALRALCEVAIGLPQSRLYEAAATLSKFKEGQE